MAINQLGNIASGTGRAAATASHTLLAQSDRMLVLMGMWRYGAAAGVSYTYNGASCADNATFSYIDETVGSSYRIQQSAYFYMESDLPAAGAHDFIGSTGGSTPYQALQAICFYGVDQSNPVVQTASAEQAANAISCLAALSAIKSGNMVLVSGCLNGGTGVLSPTDPAADIGSNIPNTVRSLLGAWFNPEGVTGNWGFTTSLTNPLNVRALEIKAASEGGWQIWYSKIYKRFMEEYANRKRFYDRLYREGAVAI